MGKVENPLAFITSEYSPIHQVADEQLIQTLQCPGFDEIFKSDSIRFVSKKYGPQIILHTGGMAHIKRGTIQGVDDKMYTLSIIRDLDNAGIIIQDENAREVSKVNYRDRRNDGKREATAPHLLQTIGNIADEDVPDRSRNIGATSWYYSSKGDEQIPGRKSVEFSITSSNPTESIADFLEHKQDKLSVDSKQLASFIDDPFAYIPFSDPSKENVDKWWTLWWHVVQRGLRDKKIPYPGQTSRKGFTGFFDHVLESSKDLLNPLGFTHLSGVPSWYYVWQLNMKNGFLPDDPVQHKEAGDFFDRLYDLDLPNGKKMHQVDYKSGLYSWITVAPFMMQLNPQYEPTLNIDHAFVNGDFKALYHAMQTRFVDLKSNEVSTYPLAPGRNLWHSLDLTS